MKKRHKIHNCNSVRPGLLPTVHLDPGLFSKTHALPKISPRPETKSIAQDAATQKGAGGDLDGVMGVGRVIGEDFDSLS